MHRTWQERKLGWSSHSQLPIDETSFTVQGYTRFLRMLEVTLDLEEQNVDAFS